MVVIYLRIRIQMNVIYTRLCFPRLMNVKRILKCKIMMKFSVVSKQLRENVRTIFFPPMNPPSLPKSPVFNHIFQIRNISKSYLIISLHEVGFSEDLLPLIYQNLA